MPNVGKFFIAVTFSKLLLTLPVVHLIMLRLLFPWRQITIFNYTVYVFLCWKSCWMWQNIKWKRVYVQYGDVKGKIINGNQYHNFSIKDFCLKWKKCRKCYYHCWKNEMKNFLQWKNDKNHILNLRSKKLFISFKFKLTLSQL